MHYSRTVFLIYAEDLINKATFGWRGLFSMYDGMDKPLFGEARPRVMFVLNVCCTFSIYTAVLYQILLNKFRALFCFSL